MKHLFLTILITSASLCTLYAQKVEGVKQFGSTDAVVYDFCFSESGEVIAVPENNIINVYDIETQNILKSYSGGHTKPILCVDISPDSSLIASGGKDSTVVIWDLISGEIIQRLNYHTGVVTDIEFSPEGNKLASSSSDNTIVLYNLETNNIQYRFREHTKDVTCIAFNSAGNILASGSEDKAIVLRNTNSGKFIDILESHKGFIRDINFNKGSSRLISCDDKSRVYIWNTENFDNIRKLSKTKHGHKWLLSANFMTTGKIYATGGTGKELRLQTLSDYKKINIKNYIYKVRFKPEAQIIILAIATHGKGVVLIDFSKFEQDTLNF